MSCATAGNCAGGGFFTRYRGSRWRPRSERPSVRRTAGHDGEELRTDRAASLTRVSGDIPVVDYLVLDDPAHLVGRRCQNCEAIFLGRHNGCGRCGSRAFSTIRLANTGVLCSYTIVHRGTRDGKPFISGLFELDGGGVVKANLIGVDTSPESIELGARVRLVTFPVDRDAEGNQAVAFGFIPI